MIINEYLIHSFLFFYIYIKIETPSRGFSYKLDGPLDMRMFSRGKEIDVSTLPDTEQALLRKSISAYEIVNFFSREQIANIIYQVSWIFIF